MDRLKESGHHVHDAQLNAPFKFIVRPFTTVGIESGLLASWFEDEIFSAVKSLMFESPIAGVGIFPMIFDREIAAPPSDYVKYKKTEKSVFVGVRIDFSLWASASKQERLHLLYENIKSSIERIPLGYLSNSDRKKLISVTTQVYGQLIGKLLH